MSQPPFDIPRAQRWFAVECNNQAWEIIEGDDRMPEAIERLINLAHAACLHWSSVGTSIHRQRALDLLAHAYVAAGQGATALRFARQAFELSEEHGAEQSPFDRAQAFGTMSIALRAADHAADAEEWKHKALAEAEGLDAEERNVVHKLVAGSRH